MAVDQTKTHCAGLTHLFFASIREVRDGIVQRPDRYSYARSVCEGCPEARACAEEGLSFDDKHTLRAGFAFWQPEERATAVAWVNSPIGTPRPIIDTKVYNLTPTESDTE